MNNTIVKVHKIRKEFLSEKKEKKVVLSDVNFVINKGETFGLAGMSASGKSVIGRIILNLIKPTSGEVFFEGQSITSLNKTDMDSIRKNMELALSSSIFFK